MVDEFHKPQASINCMHTHSSQHAIITEYMPSLTETQELPLSGHLISSNNENLRYALNHFRPTFFSFVFPLKKKVPPNFQDAKALLAAPKSLTRGFKR